MAKIRVNKSEAARRQLDVAIRMLFNNEDPVPIHTLSMAGFRILRDLAAKRSDSYMAKVTKLMIKPGMEGEFWRLMNLPSNFLKHADKDPFGVLDNIDEEANDGILCIASLFYQDLGYTLTPEMTTLVAWYTGQHPEFLLDNASPALKSAASQSFSASHGMTRNELLYAGRQLLQQARETIAELRK